MCVGEALFPRPSHSLSHSRRVSSPRPALFFCRTFNHQLLLLITFSPHAVSLPHLKGFTSAGEEKLPLSVCAVARDSCDGYLVVFRGRGSAVSGVGDSSEVTQPVPFPLSFYLSFPSFPWPPNVCTCVCMTDWIPEWKRRNKWQLFVSL